MKKNRNCSWVISAVLVIGFVMAGCGSSPVSKPVGLTGVTSYYVRADGNDANAGTSEDAPFKTLAKAVEAAAKTTVKKITVIGTLNGQTDIADSGPDEILITGKPDSPEAEKAFLKPLADPGDTRRGIVIGGLANIRLEQITIAGYPSNGILINESEQATLTVGQGAVITGNGGNENLRANYGGGILVIDGTLILQGNAALTGNYAGCGGGVAAAGGTLRVQDEVRITGNTADNEGEFWGGGGIIVTGGGTATIGGSALIADNKARSGGGILVNDGSTLTLQDNAVVKGNTANVGSDSLLYGGGGIYSCEGTITLRGKASVTGNSAAYGGGMYRKVSDLILEEEGAISGNTATQRDADIYENNA